MDVDRAVIAYAGRRTATARHLYHLTYFLLTLIDGRSSTLRGSCYAMGS